MTSATGVGSMPGDGSAAYDEAARLVIGELTDFAHLPELPGRGASADMTGRAMGLLSGLGADLQPAGWRLTDNVGVDQRRARSLLAQDLDTVEELSQGYEGQFKIQVAGPWTLAATVERPRGDKILADHGARRELAQSLAEGLTDHIADVRRRIPGAQVVVQVDEPALPAVMAAQIPTASGFSRHRSVDPPAASVPLEWVFAAITDAGGVPIAHCCAVDPPMSLFLGAGAQGLSVDLSALTTKAFDDLGGAIEDKRMLLLGVVPAVEPAHEVTERAVTDRVLRLLDMLGFDPDTARDSLVVTPSCGLAGASPEWARRAVRLSRQVAANLTS